MTTVSEHELVETVEHLLDRLEALPDGPARQTAMATVQALVELYGAGLERIVDVIAASDDERLAQALTDDELVAHLLLLHGLHPVALEDRVHQALEEVRPYLASHGGNVELVEIGEASVRLRLQGSCSGCPSSTVTLKLAIENAIRKAAPEIDEVISMDATPEAPALLQIEVSPSLSGRWTMVGGLRELDRGGLAVKTVEGREILFLKLADRFYGYHPRCPACDSVLDGAKLEGTELVCAACTGRYDVIRAGRCLDAPGLHLEPVPLLVGDDGLVKVALALTA